MTFGFADGHDNLIGYVQLPDDFAARAWARDWLEQHPQHDAVEFWTDGGDLSASEIVRRDEP